MGRRSSNVLTAASVEEVKRQLWQRGLHIVAIRTPRRAPTRYELMPSIFRVTRAEVILFTRQLATFVRVGMPILDGLAVLRDQADAVRHRVTVRKAPVSFGLVKVPGRSYYQTLRDKLRWGAPPSYRSEP